jgi:Arm DNA-binding domain
MNATISVVCWKYKPLSNSECPLFLQISQKGRIKYQSMGISVDPSNWDFKRKRLKPDCPNGEYLQKIIRLAGCDYINKAENILITGSTGGW